MSQPLALTLGEPAGIGPDITLSAWRRRAEFGLNPFYLIGDPRFIADRAARLGFDVPVAVVAPAGAAAAFATALPVVPLETAVTAEPGPPGAAGRKAGIEASRRAGRHAVD